MKLFNGFGFEDTFFSLQMIIYVRSKKCTERLNEKMKSERGSRLRRVAFPMKPLGVSAIE